MITVIDAHEDIATNVFYSTGKDISKRNRLHQGGNTTGFCVNNNVDLPRLRLGGVKLVFTSVFSVDHSAFGNLVEDKGEGYNFSKVFKVKTGLAGALEQLSYYHEVFSRLEGEVLHVKTVDDYNKLAGGNKIGFLLHIEGADFFGDSVGMVDSFFELGCRSIAFNWRNRNAFASGNNATGGLTKIGKEALKRIKSRGYIFDLAHANKESFDDVMRVIDFPVIVSHTLCRSIFDNSRNLDDSQIREIAKLGGVVCLAAIPDYIGGETVKDYVRHFQYVADLVGSDHVGFGTDFDGLVDPTDRFMKGFEDVSGFPNVLRELKKGGFSRQELEKIAYRNVQRVILSRLPKSKT